MINTYTVSKQLLYIFNIILIIWGLVLITIASAGYSQYDDCNETDYKYLALIGIFGVCTIVTASFGCSYAIRASRCIIFTFVVLLLTTLGCQIAIAIWIFNNTKRLEKDEQQIECIVNQLIVLFLASCIMISIGSDPPAVEATATWK